MSKELTFNQKIIAVQQELKAPKNQRNNFGGYNYRNVEDICEAVKPLLDKYGLLMNISDELYTDGNGNALAIEAKVAIMGEGENDMLVSTAYAGIDINRKGMDVAQSYGASSSYARKYALNGALLIDDTKDPDATNEHGKGSKAKSS